MKIINQLKAFVVCQKYVLIGTRYNGIQWGVNAFKGTLELLK